jgi:hypothetical protein
VNLRAQNTCAKPWCNTIPATQPPTRFQFLAGHSSFFKFHVTVNAANQMGMSLACMSVHEKVRYDENLGS